MLVLTLDRRALSGVLSRLGSNRVSQALFYELSSRIRALPFPSE